MSRSSDHQPFTGRIVWSAMNRQWMISVAYAHGSIVPIEEVFRAVTLAWHLENAGAVMPRVTLDRTRAVCVVTVQGPATNNGQAQKLLGVLRAYYAMHKGLPINWSAL